MSKRVDHLPSGPFWSSPPCECELRKHMDEDGWIEHTVVVDLSSIISRDLEGFLDLLSEKLVGNDLLKDINYDVVGHRGDELFIRVSGDARAVLGIEEEEGDD